MPINNPRQVGCLYVSMLLDPSEVSLNDVDSLTGQLVCSSGDESQVDAASLQFNFLEF